MRSWPITRIIALNTQSPIVFVAVDLDVNYYVNASRNEIITMSAHHPRVSFMAQRESRLRDFHPSGGSNGLHPSNRLTNLQEFWNQPS